MLNNTYLVRYTTTTYRATTNGEKDVLSRMLVVAVVVAVVAAVVSRLADVGCVVVAIQARERCPHGCK